MNENKLIPFIVMSLAFIVGTILVIAAAGWKLLLGVILILWAVNIENNVIKKK